jgi:hypothetical protein
MATFVPVTVTIEDASIDEDDSGTKILSVTVTVSTPAGGGAMTDHATDGGAAAAPKQSRSFEQ